MEALLQECRVRLRSSALAPAHALKSLHFVVHSDLYTSAIIFQSLLAHLSIFPKHTQTPQK